MTKKILKYLLYGICWGWVWLVVICLIFDLAGLEPVRTIAFDHFAENVLAAALTGIGFGTSSVVYTFGRLRRWQQTLIHFGAGMGIYLPVALSMSWIPSESAPLIVSGVVIAAAVFFIIWACFYFYYRAQTRKINERLREMNGERERP